MANRRSADVVPVDENRLYDGNIFEPVEVSKVDELSMASFAPEGYSADNIALTEEDLWAF